MLLLFGLNKVIRVFYFFFIPSSHFWTLGWPHQERFRFSLLCNTEEMLLTANENLVTDQGGGCIDAFASGIRSYNIQLLAIFDYHGNTAAAGDENMAVGRDG